MAAPRLRPEGPPQIAGCHCRSLRGRTEQDRRAGAGHPRRRRDRRPPGVTGRRSAGASAGRMGGRVLTGGTGRGFLAGHVQKIGEEAVSGSRCKLAHLAAHLMNISSGFSWCRIYRRRHRSRFGCGARERRGPKELARHVPSVRAGRRGRGPVFNTTGRWIVNEHLLVVSRGARSACVHRDGGTPGRALIRCGRLQRHLTPSP